MEKAYIKYNFLAAEQYREPLLAHLNLLGFDGFAETENGWEAYLPSDYPTADLERELTLLAQSISFSLTREATPGQNWNAVWEASFQPIRIDDFCGVRADFHAPMPNVRHEIVVNPKMAFGTGHHATTYMMLSAMQYLPMSGKKVLDYGCGTGILAILAARLGSHPIDAVDIEWEACENARENCLANDVSNVRIFHGALDVVKEREYDIILANINRNVILDSLSSLYAKLRPDGLLLVSGILFEDREIVIASAQEHLFQVLRVEERTGWLSILFKKA